MAIVLFLEKVETKCLIRNVNQICYFLWCLEGKELSAELFIRFTEFYGFWGHAHFPAFRNLRTMTQNATQCNRYEQRWKSSPAGTPGTLQSRVALQID
jgi:hypothetical protein